LPYTLLHMGPMVLDSLKTVIFPFTYDSPVEHQHFAIGPGTILNQVVYTLD